MTDSGQIIDGKYRLIEKIGAGGMGIVYAATCLNTSRSVAIKLLNTSPDNTSQNAVKRLQREARLVRKLAHPNICSVIDDGFTKDGTPYMVMPLLEGEPLNRILKRLGTLPLERAVDISVQILSALEVAHRSRIIHRDLKPGNVFISADEDQHDVVKLLDFGISKVLESDTEPLTGTGKLLGTVQYMAPERLRSNLEYDHRVDIYSMGVILYQMLTGSRPFEGIDVVDTIDKIRSTSFKRPRDINKDVPGSVEQLIIISMEKDPLKRYETSENMRTALLKAVADPYANIGDSDDSLNGEHSVTRTAPEMDLHSVGAPSKFRRIIPVFFAIMVITILSLLFAFNMARDNEPRHDKTDLEEKSKDRGEKIKRESDLELKETKPPIISDKKSPITSLPAPENKSSSKPEQTDRETESPKKRRKKTDLKRKKKPISPRPLTQKSNQICTASGKCIQSSPKYKEKRLEVTK